MRIVVTGGSGKAGRWVVGDLREHGHDVLNVDMTHDGSSHGLCAVADLTDPGQALELITGSDVVVHLAAIPAPGIRSEAETFRINALSTYNVFAAAVAAGVDRVVWASSETVLGLPFDTPPLFAPIDETIEPRPETSYALSKLLGEEIAAQLSRRSGTPVSRAADLQHHGARRLSGVPGLLGRCPRSGNGTSGAMSTSATWRYAIRLGLGCRPERLRDRHRCRGRHGDAPTTRPT